MNKLFESPEAEAARQLFYFIADYEEGYDAATQSVTLKEGEKGSVTLKLTANPSASCGPAEAPKASPSEVGQLDVWILQ